MQKVSGFRKKECQTYCEMKAWRTGGHGGHLKHCRPGPGERLGLEVRGLVGWYLALCARPAIPWVPTYYLQLSDRLFQTQVCRHGGQAQR